MNRLMGVSLVLLCAVAPMAFSQATDSNLVGTVVDASGAAVQNAGIDITNEATGVKFTTVTGTGGEYRFNNLPIGLYDITATAKGFAASSLKAVRLDLNKNTTANLTLQVGTVSTALEVTEAAANIDTTTAQVQSTFEANQIVNLPIIENANGFFGALNLSLLGAGVASNGGVGEGQGPSVGGQRPTENNFTIEGVDNNNKTVTGPLVYVPTEATAEFTLLQNQYSAEFGHSTGGQFNTIIKSGTNQFHGALYEYFQNRNLDAVDQSLARQGFTSNPRFDQNKLGGSIGGPIIKDKLFFFGNFEYAPLGEGYTPPSPVESPTAAGYSLLSSMQGLSQTNLKILQQYVPAAPKATDHTVVNGVNIPTGILPINGSFYNNFYTAIGSVDYNMSQKDQIRGRIIYNKTDSLDNLANLPEFWTTLPQRYYLATISDIHTFTPNLTNELRLGFNRFSQNYVVGSQTFPGLDQFPNITFDNDLGLQLGPDPNAPQFTIQNNYELTNNVSWTKGAHTFKFGFEGMRFISPQKFIQRQRGDYDYQNLQEYLTDQIPTDLAERGLGNTPYYGNQWATYLYATDQWRIRHNLTLDLGLRWERTTVSESENLQTLNSIANVPGLIAFNAPAVQNHNFAPRIGLAYSPGNSGTTSIRAGFGMGYDVIYDNVGILAFPPQLNPLVDACISPTNCPGFSAPFLAHGGIPPTLPVIGGTVTPAEARASTSAYIPNQEVPYSVQWNFDVQHVFHQDYTLDVRYMGTRGVHLIVQDQINKTNPPVTATQNLPTYLSAPSQAALNALPLTLNALQALSPLNPAFAAAGFRQSITAMMPIGNSSYNGLAVQLTRRFSRGLQFIGAYTWSHNIDDSTAAFFTTVLTPRRPQDFGNLRADRASSALDRRQRATMSWVWDAPFFSKDHNWMKKNLLGNWRFVGTYTAETGELVTPQSGVDSNLNGDSWPDRTIINPAGQSNVGSGVTPLTNSAGQIVAYLANNPNARYIQAGKGAYATAGRNTLQAPGINNFDLSLGKRFNFTESKAFEIRLDAENAFNHPQYTPGLLDNVKYTQYNSGDRTYLEPQNPAFAGWNGVFLSNARIVQLGAHFYF
jgi:hypothetical protein